MANLEDMIYLLCPVRNVTEKEKKFLDNYVKNLEKKRLKVHYPPRDVDQSDPNGINIVGKHRSIMANCKEVHAYWNPKSEGSVFDLGMTYMGFKPFKLINRKQIARWLRYHPGKSFTRVTYELDKKYKLK